MAITDHNYFDENIFNSLREQNQDIQFITGAEISCLYYDSMGQEHELHVPALGFDPANEELKAVLAHNQPDRRPYVNRILDKLRDNSIDLGSYDEIKARYPDTKYIGRMAIARCMYEEGYTSSIDESFDIYLSTHGEARAYVKNPLRFVSLKTAVSAILHAGGVATLGHLLYYKMDESENERLVKYFKQACSILRYYFRYVDSTMPNTLPAFDPRSLLKNRSVLFVRVDPIVNERTNYACIIFKQISKALYDYLQNLEDPVLPIKTNFVCGPNIFQPLCQEIPGDSIAPQLGLHLVFALPDAEFGDVPRVLDRALQKYVIS